MSSAGFSACEDSLLSLAIFASRPVPRCRLTMQGTCQIHWLPDFPVMRKPANRWPAPEAFKQIRLENAL
jgi:hypothetical protein